MTVNDKFYLPLAIALGDGWMSYGKYNGVQYHPLSKTASLSCAHTEDHYDYILYKVNLLEKLGFDVFYGDKKVSGNRKQQKYFRVHSCKILHSVKKQLYNENNIKIFKKEWCFKLDALALAVLWMDDGCLVHQKNKKILKNGEASKSIYHCGEISTQSFDKESNENIKYWLLKRFNIEAYLVNCKNNQYAIRINKNNLLKLIDIIKPYVEQIPSMMYKITLRYNN